MVVVRRNENQQYEAWVVTYDDRLRAVRRTRDLESDEEEDAEEISAESPLP
jgi:hypothetical protein